MSARLNVLRLRRGRTVGAGMIGIMTFLILGFVFLTDEPLIIEITEEIDLTVCPPYCDEALPFLIPIPEFDVPIEITFRPIITTTDSNGVEDVIRGELTFLQAISGLEIIQVGVPDKTFDNGNLKIELEFDTGNIFPMEIFLVKPKLDTVTIESGGTFLSQFTVPPKTSQGTDVITVIGLETVTPDCTLELPCIIGTSTEGIFTITIFDSPIGEFPQGESITTNFILTDLEINISEDIAVGISPIEGAIPVPQPEPLPELLSIALSEEPQTRIEPVNFELAEPSQIYSVTFSSVALATEVVTIIEEQTVNATEVVVEETITEDVPNNPCPDVKFDSVSFLFPTNEISETTSILNQTPEGLDFANVDLRNNRNCDLDVAIGSKWRSVTGEEFVSDISDINILTNQTIPFTSIPFDGTIGCDGFACTGQEIQFCFFGQVSTTDPVEIIDEFCGKKFFR
jgi:hypothetical protein